MDTKETVTVVAVGGALAVAAYMVYHHFTNQTDVDAQPIATPAMQSMSATLPTFAPSTTTYSPIGAIKTDPATAKAPPGVDPAQLNPSTATAHPPAPHHTIDLGDAGSNAPPFGSAVQPTDTHSSAPALTGNAALIDEQYMKLFGRHAEQSALDNWAKEFAGGYTTDVATIDKRLIQNAGYIDAGNVVKNRPDLVIQAYQ